MKIKLTHVGREVVSDVSVVLVMVVVWVESVILQMIYQELNVSLILVFIFITLKDISELELKLINLSNEC